MPVAETSLECYFTPSVRENLNEREIKVLNVIRACPKMTGREIAWLMDCADMNEVRPRISDLKDKGIIVPVGKRMCTRSKIKAFVWEARE